MTGTKAEVYIFEKSPLGELLQGRLVNRYPQETSEVKILGLQPLLDALKITRPMDEIPDQSLFWIAQAYFNQFANKEQRGRSILISHVNSDEGLQIALDLAPTLFGIIARLPDGGANRHNLDIATASRLLKENNIQVVTSGIHYQEIVTLAVPQILRSR